MFEAPDSTLVVPLWSLMWSLMTLKAPPFTEAAQPGAAGGACSGLRARPGQGSERPARRGILQIGR